MPSFLPEGDLSMPSDDSLRSLAKWCSLLVASNGNKPSPYPEGCLPLPGDDEQRLTNKINILNEA